MTKIIATSNSGSIPASTKRKASHSQSERKGDMALADHREAARTHHSGPAGMSFQSHLV
ncbi:MAG: hypothetical protein IPK44_25505 [Candidatus Accumulibacter sp.]|uniref:hypothetical protein n=1 Tax=Accumulibacter sp. TaxID=2053492 RepID=UPI002584890B|nr:hypothetical protein [Accumulibacter sp.]MBK8117645.1 hypothetical protein [Accumulibacter sp.]